MGNLPFPLQQPGDRQYRADIARGTVNESLAAPREIFRPAIIHSAFAFALVHNHPSGEPTPSKADLRLTRRIAAAAEILQINFLDHMIVGQGYFSFQEAGVLGCQFQPLVQAD
jgi:DNA repair protein RadC